MRLPEVGEMLNLEADSLLGARFLKELMARDKIKTSIEDSAKTTMLVKINSKTKNKISTTMRSTTTKNKCLKAKEMDEFQKIKLMLSDI